MTVAEVFGSASLSPHDPVRWKAPIRETSRGVYVVARVGDANGVCMACDPPFKDSRSLGVEVDLESENRRWLRSEPVVYIGKADQTIQKRVGQFYQQECGKRSPHAGGQAILLLDCDLWVYWSPSSSPLDSERTMLRAFEKETGQAPFGNFSGKRGRKRIRRISP
jgi:hypothetical protein